jgi:MFS family permease
MSEKTKISSQAILAWLGAALFFLYQYVLRVAPGLVEPELRSTFVMTANDFATLGSYFMFVYAIAQIPCGILVDKIGVKKVILGSILLCLIGNGLLIIGNSLWEAQLSRILMGLGASCAYVSCLKVASDNFPGSLRGLFMGAALTIGLFGPLLSATPLVKLIEVTGWKYAFTVLSVAGVILWFLLLLSMPHGSTDKNAKLDFKEIKEGIFQVFENRSIFAYAIMTTCFYAPFSVIADLWGVSFLTNHFNLVRAEAANITMQIYVGAAISGLLVPWLCEKYKAYNLGIVLSWFGMFIGLVALLYGGNLPVFLLIAVLVFIGMVSSSEILCFGAASRHTTSQTSGTTLGVINTFSVVGSAFMMQLVGYLLDCSWSGQMDSENLRIYCSEHYIFALTSLVIFVVLCGLFAYILFRSGERVRQHTI